MADPFMIPFVMINGFLLNINEFSHIIGSTNPHTKADFPFSLYMKNSDVAHSLNGATFKKFEIALRKAEKAGIILVFDDKEE